MNPADGSVQWLDLTAVSVLAKDRASADYNYHLHVSAQMHTRVHARTHARTYESGGRKHDLGTVTASAVGGYMARSVADTVRPRFAPLCSPFDYLFSLLQCGATFPPNSLVKPID